MWNDLNSTSIRARVLLATFIVFAISSVIVFLFSLVTIAQPLLISLIVMLLAMLLFLLLVSRILSPISKLLLHLESYAEMNGSERFIPKGLSRESDQIADCFNSLLQALDSEHEALRESEQNFRLLSEKSNAAIMVFSGNGGVALYSNPQTSILSGYESTELQSKNLKELIHPDDLPKLLDLHRKAIPDIPEESRFECRMIRQNGEPLVLEIVGARTVWQGQSAELVIMKDISTRKQAELMLQENKERFSFLAHHDSLTELPNRQLCCDRLQQAISRAKRSGQLVAILFLDLDRFKNVNDSLGHKTGDELLKEVSQRLTYWVRESDTVARLEGDEFVIILEDAHDSKYAAVVAQKLIGVLSHPFMIDGHELYVTISIGISIFPTNGNDVETLLRLADIAMYSAKEKGRDNYQYYTPDMNTSTRDILEMEVDLRRAMDNEQFLLYYQPQVNLESGALVGMEALIRWQHPEKGFVMPDRFIQLAEETGMIVSMGEWVLFEACRQNREWQDKGFNPIRVAVNISPRQFRNGNLFEVIKAVLRKTGLDPKWLELEITESMIMGNVESAISTMKELTDMGIQLAIDDFGTGYSSLGHLKRFPINRLKIDKSFVMELAVNPNDEAIASAIVAMSHSLGIEVIAEGIETEQQLSMLRGMGCEQGQGYFFSRPQPPALLKTQLFQRSG